MTTRIRPAAEADLAALTAIYNHYVATTPVTFDVEPRTLDDRRAWMATFADEGPHRLLTAVAPSGPDEHRTEDGVVAGFTFSSRFKVKPAYATTVETSIYVAPGAVGDGLGARLYAALFDELAGLDLHRAFAGIALPNPASIALHERFGFRRVGVLDEVGRKFGRYWDVAWYARPLGGDVRPSAP